MPRQAPSVTLFLFQVIATPCRARETLEFREMIRKDRWVHPAQSEFTHAGGIDPARSSFRSFIQEG